MTRAEILAEAKPILFNTEMVQAILDGRKTQTRRVAPISTNVECNYGEHEFVSDDFGNTFDYTGFVCRKCGFGVSPPHCKYPVGTSVFRPRYNNGDILYVRETWREYNGKYFYKSDQCADYDDYKYGVARYHPSIHMPKKAARIFLRVTDVRVERLQDITDEQAEKEGCLDYTSTANGFSILWNSTIKKKDLPLYGWESNPWVWVYEFERIEVTEDADT